MAKKDFIELGPGVFQLLSVFTFRFFWREGVWVAWFWPEGGGVKIARLLGTMNGAEKAVLEIF